MTGGAIVAGEYEVALLGIYGDDLPLPEANRELLPLLQRLIRLLEEGMPVLMNSAGQVVGGGYSVLGGGAKIDVISSGAGGDGVTSVGMYANYRSIKQLITQNIEMKLEKFHSEHQKSVNTSIIYIPCFIYYF